MTNLALANLNAGERPRNTQIQSPYLRILLRIKGKDPMFTCKDKYRNASPPKHRYAPPHPRQRSPTGYVRPHWPGGINICDNVEPSRGRNDVRAA
jgi:hypothetical protein